MKVVLFCGGAGMRIRDYDQSIPKPMVPVGPRPILWHVMKYYAHFGHTDFILCLGWKGQVIKDFFLSYNEAASNDFVLERGGEVRLLASDTHDWRVTFVDTGLQANVGQQLAAVKPHLEDDETFLVNYSDGLTDCPLPDLIDYFHRQQSIVTCLAVRPNQSFHLVDVDAAGQAQRFTAISQADLWMNGGFYCMSREVFDHLSPKADLVTKPFDQLMARGLLSAYRYEGFWACMDTFKEKQLLDDRITAGDAPWEVWRDASRPAEALTNGAKSKAATKSS